MDELQAFESAVQEKTASREKEEEEEEAHDGKKEESWRRYEIEAVAAAHELEGSRQHWIAEMTAEIQPLPQWPQSLHDAPGAHAIAGPPCFGRTPPRAPVNESTGSEPAPHSIPNPVSLCGFLVEPDTDIEIEEAEAIPLPTRNPKSMANNHKTNPKWLTGWLAATALVTGLILMIVLLVKQGDGKTDPIKSTSASDPEHIKYVPFDEDLPASVVDAIQDNPQSPEYKANTWMHKDPYLPSYTKEHQWVRFCLVSIYYATKGDHWFENTHWLEYETTECQWFSKATTEPICDDKGVFLTLDLHSNNLTGTLPLNFWDVKAQHLDVSHNNIQGQIPTLPANMNFIEVADLSHNQLEGMFVGEPGLSVDNLRVVRLNDNCFSGNNGLAFRFMPKLQVLHLTNNCINRPMTTNFQYTDIRELLLANNRLFGSIPTEFGLLSDLQKMDYSGNARLTGTLPSELNHLTSLLELDLRGTQFTGTFPETFCQQYSKGQLHIEANCSLMECC